MEKDFTVFGITNPPVGLIDKTSALSQHLTWTTEVHFLMLVQLKDITENGCNKSPEHENGIKTLSGKVDVLQERSSKLNKAWHEASGAVKFVLAFAGLAAALTAIFS